MMTRIMERVEHLTDEVDNLVKLVEKTMQHEGIRSLNSMLTKWLRDEVTISPRLVVCHHTLHGFKRVLNVHS